jgi:hypothetical protein
MIVEKQKWITRKDLRNNPHKAYLFGDNIKKRGYGGQAKEMRGEPNAIGIPTKLLPSKHKEAYFNDEKDFAYVTILIYNILQDLKNSDFQIVVIPEDGIGTGLARLDKTAPRIFEYLQKQLEELENA